MFFHYKYLEDGIGKPVGTKTFSVAVSDGARAGEIGRAIDQAFEGGERPTRTETEAAFQAGFLSMAGNLATLLNSIGFIVALTILLVTANTMSMAIRERRTEIAVLKTLGFSGTTVMAMVISEALLIGALGGAVGLGLSVLAIRSMPRLPIVGAVFAQAPDFGLSASVAALGLGLALVLGFVAGLVPATNALRARTVTMLRAV
jgi:putative ABC transport system permease protein